SGRPGGSGRSEPLAGRSKRRRTEAKTEKLKQKSAIFRLLLTFLFQLFTSGCVFQQHARPRDYDYLTHPTSLTNPTSLAHLYSTGAGAPPPARTDADASTAALLGRRRRMAAGAPPLAPGPHRLHSNAAAAFGSHARLPRVGPALGTPPRPELALTRLRRLSLASPP